MSHSVHPLSQSSQYDFSKSSNTAADSGSPNPNVNDDSSSRTQEIPIYDGASVQRRNFALSPPLSSSPPLTSASSSTESAGKKSLNHKPHAQNAYKDNRTGFNITQAHTNPSPAATTSSSTITEHSMLSLPRFQQTISSDRSTQPQTHTEMEQHQHHTQYPQKPNYSSEHSLHESSLASENYTQLQKRQRESQRLAHIQAATASSSTGKRPRKKPVGPDMAEQILKKMSETARHSKKRVIDDDLFREFVDIWIDVHNTHGIDPGGEDNFKNWFKNQKKFFKVIDETKLKGDCTFDCDSGMISFSSPEDLQEFVDKNKRLVPDIGEKIKKPYKIYLLMKELDMKRLSSKQSTSIEGTPMDSVPDYSVSNTHSYPKANYLSTIITPNPNEVSDTFHHTKSLETANPTDHLKNKDKLELLEHSENSETSNSQCPDPRTNEESSPAPSIMSASRYTLTPKQDNVYATNRPINSDPITLIRAVEDMDGFSKDEKARFLSHYLPSNTSVLFQPVHPSNVYDLRLWMKYTIYCLKKNYLNSPINKS